jgi:excisionase family DNA binding protein
MSEIITVKEAAEILAVSGMTVRRLINSGALPAWRVAGTGPVRLSRLDVEAMRVPVCPPDEEEEHDERR